MTNRKNIHAYTEVIYENYPAYISINHEQDPKPENWWQSKAEVTVRSPENGGSQIAVCNLTLAELESLATAIFDYVYQGDA